MDLQQEIIFTVGCFIIFLITFNIYLFHKWNMQIQAYEELKEWVEAAYEIGNQRVDNISADMHKLTVEYKSWMRSVKERMSDDLDWQKGIFEKYGKIKDKMMAMVNENADMVRENTKKIDKINDQLSYKKMLKKMGESVQFNRNQTRKSITMAEASEMPADRIYARQETTKTKGGK